MTSPIIGISIQSSFGKSKQKPVANFIPLSFIWGFGRKSLSFWERLSFWEFLNLILCCKELHQNNFCIRQQSNSKINYHISIKCSAVVLVWHATQHIFYIPTSKDRRFTILCLSACLSVHLSVCTNLM